MRFGRREEAPSAFTLVEALVVAALFALVAGLFMQSYGQGSKNSDRLDGALETLRLAALVRGRLADDLASHMPVGRPADGAAEGEAIEFARVVDDDGAGLAGTCVDGNWKPICSRVIWRFDRPTGRLLRNGRAVGGGRFSRVVFRHVPCDPERGEGERVELVLSTKGLDGAPEGVVTRDFAMAIRCPQATTDRVYDERVD